jgi:N utilization substance protein B
LISAKAANWEIRRMAAVDRNTLRLAAAELIHFKDSVPFKVVIDEAVEIAKTYGTDDSGKFVNGILDSIRKDLHSKAGNGSGKEEKDASAAD